MPTEPPGRADRRSQIRPAWLLAGAAAGAVLVLAAFALPGSSTHTSVSTASTSPTPSQVSATKSTGTTSEDSSMPAQPNMTAGRARGHDQHKDGKK